MCGIAGIISKEKLSPESVQAYLERFRTSLSHRGPNDHGAASGDDFAILHRRLSIVDISGGHQPIYSDDGKTGIAFNGEVYNYVDLRDDLIGKGHRFHTNTDTEVILKAYLEYGVESFSKLNGMFAFCIWDLRDDTFYLVRDTFGIKPLYIYQDAAKLIFSSELKAILGIPDLDLSPALEGFQDYLSFRYIQAPYTLFKRIQRLEAGTYLRIKQGTSVQLRYRDLDYQEPYPRPDLEEMKERVHSRIQAAVKSQLMGEVPIGVLLSGGIDSSTIAYFVHKTGANLTTFNIGFPDVNEFEYSRAVAKQYGLKHVEVLTTPEELISDLDEIIWALDEPIADPACFPLYALAKELKKHVTVVLSGEGGDELFAGYPQYASMMQNGVPYQKRFDAFLQRSWYFDNYREFLLDDDLPPHTRRFEKYFEEQPLLNGMLAYDMKTWMPDNLMMKADKILMAHSLEGRFPFLDRELSSLVSRLPQDWKFHRDGTTKWLLKEIIMPYLPQSIINRPKMGFTVPVDLMLLKLKPLVMATLEDARISEIASILNIQQISKVIMNYYEKGEGLALQAWTLFILLYWFRKNTSDYRISFKDYIADRDEKKNRYAIEPVAAKPAVDKNNNPFFERDRIRYEVSNAFLKGKGMEIGAGAFPSRLPDGAVCEYFDKRSVDELSQLFNVNQKDLLQVHSLEVFWEKFPAGADFIIAHNVLEHAADPIGTLIQWHRYVKNGGTVVVSVPASDNNCPDAGRLIATFEHVLTDHILNRNNVSFESREHVYSFLLGMGWLNEGVSKDKDKFELARTAHQIAKGNSDDLHWHAFDTSLFEKIVKTCAVLDHKSLTIETRAAPDMSESKTLGDIIFVYRIYDAPAGETNFSNAINDLRNSFNKLVSTIKLEEEQK